VGRSLRRHLLPPHPDPADRASHARDPLPSVSPSPRAPAKTAAGESETALHSLRCACVSVPLCGPRHHRATPSDRRPSGCTFPEQRRLPRRRAPRVASLRLRRATDRRNKQKKAEPEGRRNFDSTKQQQTATLRTQRGMNELKMVQSNATMVIFNICFFFLFFALSRHPARARRGLALGGRQR